MVSIDAKKRELVGAFEYPGRRWCRRATDVNAHDFPDDAVCRATPYGVYAPERNLGHVCVGTSGNTADLAADAVAVWWRWHGRRQFPAATALLIEADGGGSNGSRSRRFKLRLQEFADATGLAVTVCHYPPGASRWNPIEHLLFSQISAAWSGIVLETVAVLVGWIRRTTTAAELRVTARVMAKAYPTGRKVTAAEFRGIRLTASSADHWAKNDRKVAVWAVPDETTSSHARVGRASGKGWRAIPQPVSRPVAVPRSLHSTVMSNVIGNAISQGDTDAMT